MKDINFLSVTTPGQIIEDREIVAPQPEDSGYWSDLVHVNVPDVVIRRCRLDARFCWENVIDGNCAHNLLVEDCEIIGGRECSLYVKGLHGAMFRRCRLAQASGHSDGYAGDYSDQSSERTTGVVFEDCTLSDGTPFRIRWAHAERPKAVNMAAHYLWPLSFVSCIYVKAKYALPSIIP
jgi:hypothetical protein